MDINKLLDDTYDHLKSIGLIDLIYETYNTYGFNEDYLSFFSESIKKNSPSLYKEFMDSIYNLICEAENIKNDSKLEWNELKIKPHPLLNVLMLTNNSAFLSEINYKDIVSASLKSLSEKVNENNKNNVPPTQIFTQEDFSVIEALSLYNYNAKINEGIIACLIAYPKTFSKLTLYSSLGNFAKNQYPELKQIVIDQIGLISDTCNGTSINNGTIVIKESLIEEMYEKGSYRPLVTISHELRHQAQDKIFKEQRPFFNSYLLNMIKENVIFMYNEEYYRENYENISFEVDAFFFGIQKAAQFLKEHGFEKYSSELELVGNNYQKKWNEISSIEQTRTLNGKPISLEDIFIETINMHPEELERFPKLKYVYKLENGIVTAKTIEEMENDLKDILSSEIISENEKQIATRAYTIYFEELQSLSRK